MHAAASRRWALALALVTAIPVCSARAQEPAPAPAPGLVPPRLVQSVEPTYPEEKRAAAESATVGLVLTIAATGAVTEAKVTESAGSAFDEAALEAARRLVFEPARRAGQPLAARIPFRFSFVYQPPSPAVAAPTTGLLTGKVVAADGAPLAGASITIQPASGDPPRVVAATSDGAFEQPLAPGEYRIAVNAPGHEPLEAVETIVAGEAASLVYRLRLKPPPPVAGAVQDIEVVGERPPREVTRRQLERAEIARIPGTNGDAIRAIENMPGVARPPGFQGLLIVRGSAPADTGVFVDGTNIPIAYHFGGLNSVVPSELLSRIDFFPGNFGPEYGRAMGGVVDIGIRSPAKDKIHGLAQIDLIDARLLIEAPLGKSTRFLAAARRSHLDAWLGPVLEAGGGVGVSVAPVYYDYQVVLEQDLGPKTVGRLLFHGSDDRLVLSLNAPSGDPAISGNLGIATRFFRIQARTDTRLGDSTRWVNMISYGQDWSSTQLGTLDLNIRTNPLQARSDLRHTFTRGLTAIVGVDALWTQADVNVFAAPIPEDGQENGPFFARPKRRQQLETSTFQPAAYAMLEIAPVPTFKLLPSVRADYSSDIRDWRAAPRLAARWDVITGDRRTTLKGGAGLYHQPPQPYESLRPFGTPNLRHNQAQHYSAGFEQEITKQVELSLEGFYKKLDYLVDQRPDAAGSESGVTYVNSGSGRVVGSELLLRYRPDARFFGWVAYTLSRSERRADDSEAFRIFDYDQTHILTALGSVKLGRGWEVGARFRYVSGNPYTPPTSAIFDADAGAYSPINGTPFSGRVAAFHRLDVRVDKTWQFARWKLGAYLDLQNTYFRRNAEGQQYNFNYSRTDVVAGLPILPIIGLRGEL